MATVPIDEDLQHLAIDLDRANQEALLPFLRDLHLIVERIAANGEEGIKFTKAARAAEHSSLRTADYTTILERLTEMECFEKTARGKIRVADGGFASNSSDE